MLLKRPLLRVFFLALLSAFIAAVPACTDSDGQDNTDPPPSMNPGTGNTGDVITCNASLSPGEIQYALTSDGRLILSPGTPRETSISPLGVVRGSLVGRWLLIDKTEDNVHLRAELRIDLNEVAVSSGCTARGKTVIAVASSPSSFDDDSLFIFEAASKTVEIR